MKPNHVRRRQQLRKAIRQSGANAALITDPVNVTWLTGFDGDSSWLLVQPRAELLISDSRYEVQIGEQCPGLDCEIRTARHTLPAFAASLLKKARLSSLALESDHLTHAGYASLADALPATQVIPARHLVEPLRAIKDEFEIATIRQSIAVAERAFAVIRAQLTPDQSELQIAHNLEHQIRKFGGTRCSFDPIVGVGPRGALPHGQPSQATVGQSPFMLIDWGASYQGYASDLTRILVTGKISPKLRRLYNIVLDAQHAAIGKIRPGAPLAEVDRAARGLIADARLGRKFGHGLGHGFGLQIHESPFISPRAEGTLQPGMVVTVEPGVYLPDWGGIRIEDDVLVTPDGSQILSTLPRELDECVVPPV